MERIPHRVEIMHKRGRYAVHVYNIEQEEIDVFNYGSDLLGALIRAQKIQDRECNPPTPCVSIVGFPNKHPNQTTLDDI